MGDPVSNEPTIIWCRGRWCTSVHLFSKVYNFRNIFVWRDLSTHFLQNMASVLKSYSVARSGSSNRVALAKPVSSSSPPPKSLSLNTWTTARSASTTSHCAFPSPTLAVMANARSTRWRSGILPGRTRTKWPTRSSSHHTRRISCASISKRLRSPACLQAVIFADEETQDKELTVKCV
jgi:hypothetical protein